MGKPPLTKRWTLPSEVADHIFDGTLSGAGHTGFHSEAEKSIENGRVRFEPALTGVQSANRLAGRPYWGKAVFAHGSGSFQGRDGKVSCFFPHPTYATDGKPWTRDYIKLKIEQALTAPGDSSRESRAAWTSQPRQIRLSDVRMPLKTIRVSGIRCGVIYQDGSVASVYPMVEGYDPKI